MFEVSYLKGIRHITDQRLRRHIKSNFSSLQIKVTLREQFLICDVAQLDFLKSPVIKIVQATYTAVIFAVINVNSRT